MYILEKEDLHELIAWCLAMDNTDGTRKRAMHMLPHILYLLSCGKDAKGILFKQSEIDKIIGTWKKERKEIPYSVTLTGEGFSQLTRQ